jgi:hypothetical protein
MPAESRWLRVCSGLTAAAAACGWPQGLPSDSSYSDDSAGDSSTTTSSTISQDATSSGGTTTSGADESSSEDGGPSFIQDPDGGSKNILCSLWKNDCPRGEKCMPWANDGGSSWNATKCTPLDPDPNAPGEPCTVVDNGVSGIDDCEAFAMCWDVDPRTLMGECIAFCRGSEANPVCEDPNTQCSITGDGVIIPCLPNCDPLAQECGEGEGCYPVDNHFECAPDVSGEDGAAGDVCEFINVCDPSLFCASADSLPACDGTSCCTPFCDLASPTPTCPLFTECVPFYSEDQAPPGDEDVGGCMTPP